MLAVGSRLMADLELAIAAHVRPSEQDEFRRDVETERQARATKAGVEAGEFYVRQVIASLTLGDAD